MYTEKRREERTDFTRQPKGTLQILAGERCLPVSAVRDMSRSGLRLETDARMEVGENVLIRYQTADIDLKLNGVVVWSADTQSSGYAVGIQLASPLLLETFW